VNRLGVEEVKRPLAGAGGTVIRVALTPTHGAGGRARHASPDRRPSELSFARSKSPLREEPLSASKRSSIEPLAAPV
jgi:hypothetical protein